MLSEQQDVKRRPTAGWDGTSNFVRRGRHAWPTRCRARSGFDASSISAVRAGTLPPTALPPIIYASHQIAWTVFASGRAYPQPFPGRPVPGGSGRRADVQGGPANWAASLQAASSWPRESRRLAAHRVMHLPKMGIGATAMLMQDRTATSRT
jgi:hypothetical protein